MKYIAEYKFQLYHLKYKTDTNCKQNMMIRNGFFTIVLFLFFSMNGIAEKQLNILDFGVSPENRDCTPGLIKSLQACKDGKDIELIFPKGVYNFYPDFGVDKYCFISNNDEGLKRVVFLLEKMKNFTINGQGSSFIFHGFINPFVINNSSNVTFKNFSIDFFRPFHSEATITAQNSDGLDIDIPVDYPYIIDNGILVFIDEELNKQINTKISRENIYPYGILLEFDSKKQETANMARDYFVQNTPLPAISLGERKVRIFHKTLKGTPGNTLVFDPSNRNYPGFAVSDCNDIRFENITIYHAGGMGIVAQRTHNIAVVSCKVTPSAGRAISCTADATHFVNCTGKIELGNCLFQNQMDDATNIHGIYVQIAKKIAPNEVIVQLKHYQQLGFDFLEPGTLIEFVHGKSLITKGTAKIISSKRINKDFTTIILSKDLPNGIQVGDAIADISELPFVHIHDNIIRKNRARGMLLNCKGKTIVENNTFHSAGAAILFEGDANFWFEQGGVSDCTIRNNIFDNCMFGVWGEAVLDVKAGIKERRDVSRYNKNIKIINNTFRVFDDALLLQTYCVDGLIWKDNNIEKNNEYPATRTNKSLFKVENSDNIKIEL